MSMPPSQTLRIEPDAHGLRRVDFRAMGTHCSIQWVGGSHQQGLQFLDEALGWLQNFEAQFSRFRTDSMLSRINAAAGRDWVAVDASMEAMLDRAAAMHQFSRGILDATALPLILLWDWKRHHTELPSPAEVKLAKSLCDWSSIKRRPGEVFLPKAGMGLDFGGFGKEYAVDQVAAIAKRHGLSHFLIDLGRDIMTQGGNGRQPFWHVGIQDGSDPQRCVAGVAASGIAVCASGNYTRYFQWGGKRYGHILDPRSGWPCAKPLHAVTVLAANALLAGIVSTTLVVLGREEGLHFARATPGIEACLQDETGLHFTPRFEQHLIQAAA